MPWVTMSTPIGLAAQMSSSSVCMRSRVSASSAPSGSSISRKVGLGGERAREADALAHAAGQLPDRLVAETVELDLGEQRVGARRRSALGDAAHPEREGHVLARR